MRMRNGFLLALGLAAGCAEGDSGSSLPVEPDGQSGQAGRGAGVRGLVFTVTSGPDSGTVGVPGAEVVLVRVGDLPQDTVDTFPPPPPGDTMLMLRRGYGQRLGLLFDTVPTPPDTMHPPPPDTIFPPPPDTVIPPPPDTVTPPPSFCREGETVARVRTNRAGKFAVNRLRPGIYNLLVEPPPGSTLSPNAYCNAFLRAGEPTTVNIYLWQGPGPDPIPGDSL